MEKVMASPPIKRIIPKEEAVFWLDQDGYWRNKHGRFEHPKIIKYFHHSIRKDDEGYHVYQESDDFIEKVYFVYEDTALFVFDIIKEEPISLLLNTGKRIPLIPDQLFIQDDHLYIQNNDHRIKFAERALVKISALLGEKDDQLYLTLQDTSYRIRQA